MVFLALSREGLAEALRMAKQFDGSVWCGANAMTESEFEAGGHPGLSRFSYSLEDASAEQLADARSTIEEHHPGERIWIEGES
jgi:hypothetical protein